MEVIVALTIVAIVVIILLMLLFSAIRVVQEYERGVIFVLGKLIGAKGPGIFLVPPFVTRMIKVDLRVVTLTVPPQEVISRDNVTIKVTAVVYFYVVDPVAAVVNVMNYMQATTQIGQTTLRNVLGQSDLDELLSQRNKINRELQTIIDEHTERWGVKVTAVEIKDVELPSTMQRAMAKQAEAEREKRAKIIHAQGELQASAQLAQAAQVIGSQPATLQLRYLQTLTEIAVEKNSTIIFPLPIDLVEPLLGILKNRAGASSVNEYERNSTTPTNGTSAPMNGYEEPVASLPPIAE
jgi:regulator of protease activity HflC (stomatin/prohibitin superfamily)